MRRRLSLATLVVALAAAVFWFWQGHSPPSRPDIAGPATVVDGDTIAIGGRRIRLEGLDAPESAQTCERNGGTWPCGRDATLALRQRLHGREVRCTAHGQDRYRRILAQCWLGEDDIAGWMVSEGMAVAYTSYSWRYVPQELSARWHGRGLWAGRFETPEEWRRRH